MLQRDYELTFILSSALDEDASTALVERVNHLIAAGSGTVTEMHAWGRRRLAYPLMHHRDGFYMTTRFTMPTAQLSTFENDLRLNEHILRHLILRQDEVPLKPLAPLAGQSHSASRGSDRTRSEDYEDHMDAMDATEAAFDGDDMEDGDVSE